MDPYDTSLDFTGQIEGESGGVAANEEGYFGNGWDPEGAVILPGGDDAYTPGGTVGLKQDKEDTWGDHDPPDDDDDSGSAAGDMSGDEHTRFILGLRDIPVGAERAIEAYIVEHLGEGWDVNPGAYEPEPCIGEYVIPWDLVDEDCLPAGLDGEALEELCDKPCIYAREVPVSGNDIDLDIITNDVDFASDWIDLIDCAWTLLQDNWDLIDFIMCTLTGNPGAGDCLQNKIDDESVTIELDDRDDPSANARYVLVFPWGDKIKIFTDEITDKSSNFIFMWNLAGGSAFPFPFRDCACVGLAATLLHELIHSCLRDLFDSLREGDDCSLAEMLENSFLFMLSQRYLDSVDVCCVEFGADSAWWNEFNVALDPGCTLQDD